MNSPWSNFPQVETEKPETKKEINFEFALKDAEDVSDFILYCAEAQEKILDNVFKLLPTTPQEYIMGAFDVSKDIITIDPEIEKSYFRLLKAETPCGFVEFKMKGKNGKNGKSIPISSC